MCSRGKWWKVFEIWNDHLYQINKFSNDISDHWQLLATRSLSRFSSRQENPCTRAIYGLTTSTGDAVRSVQIRISGKKILLLESLFSFLLFHTAGKDWSLALNQAYMITDSVIHSNQWRLNVCYTSNLGSSIIKNGVFNIW